MKNVELCKRELETETSKGGTGTLNSTNSNSVYWIFVRRIGYHAAMRCVRVTLAIVAAGALSALNAQDSSDRNVLALAAQPAVKSALAAAKANEPQTIDQQIRLSEIPAPTFHEGARGEEMKRLFEQTGLTNVRIDKAGNVLGERRGAAPQPHVVLAAHLDTVFPEGTNVKVRRDGSLLYGPGIGDDARGLAVLLAVARAMDQGGVRTPGSITFVASVGEEGLGDLRGMKALFDETLKGTVDRFVTVDGTGMSIAHTFVGSRRYRVTYRGPGGHSFTEFGTPNPASALGRAIAKIAAFQVPAEPQTTFNVGRIGGGTSVNAIPTEAWMEVDLRSVDRAALAALDARLLQALDAALAEEHARWQSKDVLTVTKDVVGDRPAGVTRAASPIVQAAEAATRAVGAVPASTVSSSDANYPTSLGIPSVQIGGGGRGADAHAPGESFDTTDSWRGTQRALLLTIALAQN
jgi:acetylornithine deacetylase/succinyl-diaminopimelate desuccinylase-like protein